MAQSNSMPEFAEDNVSIRQMSTSNQMKGDIDFEQPPSLCDNLTSNQMIDINATNNPFIYDAELANPFFTGLLMESSENLATNLLQVHSSINNGVVPLSESHIASVRIPSTANSDKDNILNPTTMEEGTIVTNEIGSLFEKNNIIPVEAGSQRNNFPVDEKLVGGQTNMANATTHRAQSLHARTSKNTKLSNVSQAKRVSFRGSCVGDRIPVNQTIIKKNSSTSSHLDAIPSTIIEGDKAVNIPAQLSFVYQASQSPPMAQNTHNDCGNAAIYNLPNIQESLNSFSQHEPDATLVIPSLNSAVPHSPYMATTAKDVIQPPSNQSAYFSNNMVANTVGQNRDGRASRRKDTEEANLMQRSDRVEDVNLTDDDLFVEEDDSDDEGGRSKKIKIEYIGKKRNRQVTFLKRKNGVMKKAMELGILTGCEIAIIVHNNDNGKTFEYSSEIMEKVLHNYATFSGPLERRTTEKFFDLAGSKMNLSIPLDQPELSQAATSAATAASLRPRPYHKFDPSVKVEVVRVNGKRLSSGETAPVAVGRRNQGKPVQLQPTANRERPRKYVRISDSDKNAPLPGNSLRVDCCQDLDGKCTEPPLLKLIPSSNAAPAPWIIDDAEAPAPTTPLITRRSSSSNLPDVLPAFDIAELTQSQPVAQETERRATETQCRFPLQIPVAKGIPASLQLQIPVSPINSLNSPISVATKMRYHLGAPAALANGQSTWGQNMVESPRPCEITWPELEAAISPVSCPGTASKDVWNTGDVKTREEDIRQEQSQVISTEGAINSTEWAMWIDQELMADQPATMEPLVPDIEPLDYDEGNNVDWDSLLETSPVADMVDDFFIQPDETENLGNDVDVTGKL